MFTGIIREVGRIEHVAAMPGGDVRLRVAAPESVLRLTVGASISVDGVCLTAVEVDEDAFEVQVVSATIERTIAGTYLEGAEVNLEPAVSADAALDGHIVQGHVDGVGTVLARDDRGSENLLTLRIPEAVGSTSIPQGSIAVNGVSLTLESLFSDTECRVAIIPHTAEVTTLSQLRQGDDVNIEGDLIGKHVGRYLARRFPNGRDTQ